MKRCSVCLERKPLEAFGANQAAKDSRMNKCRECNRRSVGKHYEKNNGTREERENLQNELYIYITLLRNQGHQLKEIAEATGLDKSSISYYLGGKRKVGMNAVRKYAKRHHEDSTVGQ